MLAALLDKFRRVLSLFRPSSLDPTSPEGRAHERHRRAAWSALTAALAKFLSVGTVLISVPLTLNYLGPERYGMWMVISSFNIMLSFADLGLGNGILSTVASSHGNNDRQAIRTTISSGFFVLCSIAALLGVLFVAVNPFVQWEQLFNVATPLAREESAPAIAIFVLCFVLNIPLGLVQKVQIGLQKGFTANLWQCLGSVFSLAAMLLVIRLDGGVPWLVVAVSGGSLLASLANSIVFLSVQQPDLLPKRDHVSVAEITHITHTGLLFFTLQGIICVAFASDNIIIAQLLDAKAVTTYAIPEKMFALITSLVVLALNPFWPAYSEAVARGDHQWIRKTLIRSVRFAILASAAGSAALIIFGNEITAMWVGHDVNPPMLLLICFGAWKVLEAAGNALAVYLNGAGQLRMQLYFLIPMGISSILLKIVLLKFIGLPGIVLGVAVPYLVFVLLPWSYILRRRLKADQ